MILRALYPICRRRTPRRAQQFARLLAAISVPQASRCYSYRDKTGSPQDVLRAASILRDTQCPAARAVSSSTTAPTSPSRQLRRSPRRPGAISLRGRPLRRRLRLRRLSPHRRVSTHTYEQVRIADQSCADYIAIGPVITTTHKRNPDPVVGLEGVRRARASPTSRWSPSRAASPAPTRAASSTRRKFCRRHL